MASTMQVVLNNIQTSPTWAGATGVLFGAAFMWFFKVRPLKKKLNSNPMANM